MDFLNEYHLAGLAIGICTFLIIGVFHPVVVKAEYYWGTRCWWVFLLLGLGGVAASVWMSSLFWSSLLGVFAFSSFCSRVFLGNQFGSGIFSSDLRICASLQRTGCGIVLPGACAVVLRIYAVS